MAKFEVEVIGHFSTIIEVEAETDYEAESEAISVFESDFDVVANMGAESWDYTSIESVEEMY